MIIDEETANLFITVNYSALIINNNIQSESAVQNQVSTLPVRIINCDFNSNNNQSILIGFKIIYSSLIDCNINVQLLQIQIIDDGNHIISPIYETTIDVFFGNDFEFILDGIETSIEIGNHLYFIEIQVIRNDSSRSISRAVTYTCPVTAVGGTGRVYFSNNGASSSWGTGYLLPFSNCTLQSNYLYYIKLIPSSGQFVKWVGPVASSTSISTTIKISAPNTLVAHFQPAPNKLTIQMIVGTTPVTYNALYGTVTHNGTAYSGPVQYLSTTNVSLKFTNGSCEFVQWTANVISPNSNPTNVDMSTSKAVAVYVKYSTINITITRSSGMGIVNTSVGSKTTFPVTFAYNKGLTCTLVAQPAAGNTFLSWTGTDPIVGNPSTQYVTASSNKTVDVKFSTTMYTINTQIYLDGVLNPSGGTVTLTPNLASYPHGTVVNMNMSPNSNIYYYTISGYPTGFSVCTPDVPLPNKCYKFTVTANLNIKVYFKTKYELTVDINAPGTGTCKIRISYKPSATATTLYVDITTFPTTIIAIGGHSIQPNLNYSIQYYSCVPVLGFVNWSFTGTLVYPATTAGNIIKMTDTSETLILNLEEKFYNLKYQCQLYTTTYTSTITTSGSITSTPNNPSDHDYAAGTSVALLATPVTAGFSFVAWHYSIYSTTGTLINSYSQTAPILNITMNYDTVAVAYFKGPTRYTLTITEYLNSVIKPYSTVETATVNGVAYVPTNVYEYNPGDVVNLTTTPKAPYIFVTWSTIVSTPLSNSTTIVMNASRHIAVYYKSPTTPVKYNLFYRFFRRGCPSGAYIAPNIGNLTLTPPTITTGMVDGYVQYDAGTAVNIKANIVNTDYIFEKYTVYNGTSYTTFESSTAQIFTTDEITVKMNTSKLVCVYFTKYCLTIRVYVDGVLTANYSNVCSLQVDSVAYSSPLEYSSPGTTVDLQTTPIGIYSFNTWSTNTSSPTNVNTTVVINDNVDVNVYYSSSSVTTKYNLFYRFYDVSCNSMRATDVVNLTLNPPNTTTSTDNGYVSYDVGTVVNIKVNILDNTYELEEAPYQNAFNATMFDSTTIVHNLSSQFSITMNTHKLVQVWVRQPCLIINVYLNGAIVSNHSNICTNYVNSIEVGSTTAVPCYPLGSTINLNTVPIGQYSFVNWSANTSSPTTTTTTTQAIGDYVYVNVFYSSTVVITKYRLYYKVFEYITPTNSFLNESIGSIKLEPPNVIKLVQGYEEYGAGSIVDATATVINQNYKFYKWKTYICDINEITISLEAEETINPVDISMGSHKSLVAFFRRNRLLINTYLNGVLVPYGTVCTVNVDSIPYVPTTPYESPALNTIVNLQTIPVGTYIFSEWSPNTSSPTNTNTTVTMSDDMTVNVYYISPGTVMVKLFYHFVLLDRTTMTVSVADDNTGYLHLLPPNVDTTSIHNGFRSYSVNTNLEITAIPKTGYSYVGSSVWNLSAVGLSTLVANINAADTATTSSLVTAGTLVTKSTNPYFVSLDVDKFVIVTFERQTVVGAEICETLSSNVIIHPMSDSNSGEILDLMYEPTFTTLTDIPVSFSFRITCPLNCKCEITIYRDTLSSTNTVLSTDIVYQDLNFIITSANYNQIVNINTTDSVINKKYKYYVKIKYIVT